MQISNQSVTYHVHMVIPAGGGGLRDFVCGIVIVIKWSGLFISETAESAGEKEKEKIQFSG